jgi:hypothetical protein
MAVTVLDSSDIEGMVKDATGEGFSQEAKEAKEPPKVDPNPEFEEEDENGLTASQKAELTAKMQKAIGKKTRQLREAEEFAAEEFKARRQAEQRLAQMEAEIQALKANPAPVVEAVKTKPERQNFATDGEYIDAVVQHNVAEALAKREAEQAAANAKAESERIAAEANARIAAARELVPDFDDVVSAANVAVPDHIAGYMQQSEMFAELGYFLAQNPEVITAIGKMNPAKQLVEIGKIEAKLQPFKTNGEKPTVNGTPKAAPREATGETPSVARRTAPVITPISSTSGAVDIDPETANVKDHIADFARRRGTNLVRRQRH